MRILLTGATGFLGGHIADELCRHDVEIAALVRPGDSAAALDAQGIAVIRADLSDPGAVRQAVEGMTHVIHAAALIKPGRSAADYHAVNVAGATNLLDACLTADVQGILHVSSTSMYGSALPPWPVDESWAFRPDTPARLSLATAERAVRTYHRRLPLIVLRPALPFGPRDSGVVLRVLTHFLDKPRPRLVGGGRAPLSLVFAPDLARAVWGALDQIGATQDHIFHVSSIDTDWRTVLDETFALLHREPHYLPIPHRLARAAERLGAPAAWITRPPRDVERYADLLALPHLIDGSRLRLAIGFSPLFGLRAALRQTLEWLGETRSDIRL